MPQRRTRVLTGITPSGTPHIGNYVGAVRPAIAASRAPQTESFYFLSDLHSLIKTQDPARVQQSTLEIAATWLAAGLSPDTVWFYRQSDIPEISELMWLLTCIAGKGPLNRAHAYKAAVDKNRAEGLDEDAGISAGLFLYPVLMAADILMFGAHQVPVGRDQVQHIEMARDFGQRFNHVYGREWFTLPEALIDDKVATLPGLDGRKMSKTYTFCEIRGCKSCAKPRYRVTALFQIYQAFASPEQTRAFAQAFADGIAWGEAKQQVFALLDAEIAPLRERYQALMARPGEIEEILRTGAQRLRARYATPLMVQLREAVGLRNLGTIAVPAAVPALSKPAAAVNFKQYREVDGRFYFKLVEGERVLLQSHGFDAPREAGQVIARLKRGELALDNMSATLGDGVSADEVSAALAAMSTGTPAPAHSQAGSA